jgi:hypothetical protein
MAIAGRRIARRLAAHPKIKVLDGLPRGPREQVKYEALLARAGKGTRMLTTLVSMTLGRPNWLLAAWFCPRGSALRFFEVTVG